MMEGFRYICVSPRFPCCGAPRSCLTGLASSANAMGKGREMAISRAGPGMLIRSANPICPELFALHRQLCVCTLLCSLFALLNNKRASSQYNTMMIVAFYTGCVGTGLPKYMMENARYFDCSNGHRTKPTITRCRRIKPSVWRHLVG